MQTIFSCMDLNKIWYTISAIFGLHVQQILKIKENMSNSRSKFQTNF